MRGREGVAVGPPAGQVVRRQRACASASACCPSRSPTCSRWSATPPTGSPACPGWGAKSAAAVLDRWGHLEAIPADPLEWDAGVRERRQAQRHAPRGLRAGAAVPSHRHRRDRRTGRHGRRLGVARPHRRLRRRWPPRWATIASSRAPRSSPRRRGEPLSPRGHAARNTSQMISVASMSSVVWPRRPTPTRPGPGVPAAFDGVEVGARVAAVPGPVHHLLADALVRRVGRAAVLVGPGLARLGHRPGARPPPPS